MNDHITADQDYENQHAAIIAAANCIKKYCSTGRPINTMARVFVGIGSQILAETLDKQLIAEELREVADKIEQQEGDIIEN